MSNCVRRREFLGALSGAAAWPLAARAQQPAKIARIGFLGTNTQSAVEDRLTRFRAGLRDLGYVEGGNLLIDFRWAEQNYARLTQFAAELIRLRVDVVVTYGTPGTLAAKGVTRTIPIVMIVSGDALTTGLVATLARPGGNVTGSTFFDPELSAKRLELIKEIRPSAGRIAVLLNPDNLISTTIMEAMGLTAKTRRLELVPFAARTPDDVQSVLSRLAQNRVDAIAVTSDTLFISFYRKIAEMANGNRIPSFGDVEFGQAGGLIGYGANLADLWYRAAFFVDRILKGVKPADIPVERPTKFDLVINLVTARALGVTLPLTLQALATQVIE